MWSYSVGVLCNMTLKYKFMQWLAWNHVYYSNVCRYIFSCMNTMIGMDMDFF